MGKAELKEFISSIKQRRVLIEIGMAPREQLIKLGNAAELKRSRRYEESINRYLFAAKNYRFLSTEFIRMFAKTLCCANEYLAAFYILSVAGAIEESKYPGARNTPNTCSKAVFDLVRAASYACDGRLEDLLNYTDALSGQPMYSFEKSKEDIVFECQTICFYLRSGLARW